MTANSQSDSAIQRDAEGAIVAALAAKLGVTLVSGGTLPLSGGVKIQLDARSEDGKFAVEAYARQGVLRGGQLKKIAQDVLKLALLRREPDYAEVRPIIVFASEEARSSITGWVKRAAEADVKCTSSTSTPNCGRRSSPRRNLGGIGQRPPPGGG